MSLSEQQKLSKDLRILHGLVITKLIGHADYSIVVTHFHLPISADVRIQVTCIQIPLITSITFALIKSK